MAKLCKKCNHTNTDSANYCAVCGAILGNRRFIVVKATEYERMKDEHTILTKETNEQRNNILQLTAEATKLKKDIETLRKSNTEKDRNIYNMRSKISTLERERNQLRESRESSILYKTSKHIKDIFEDIFEDGLWNGIGILLGLIISIPACLFVIWIIFSSISDIIVSCSGSNKDRFEIVEQNAKYGLMDKDNDKMVIPYSYDTIYRMKDNSFFILMNDGKIGIADSAGVKRIDTYLDSITYVSNGYHLTYIKDKMGLIDKYGNVICPTIYADISCKYNRYNFNGKIIPIKKQKGEGWTILNGKGEKITDEKLSYAPYFIAENLIAIRKYNKMNEKYAYRYGIMDEHGKYILPVEYSEIYYYFEGLSWIQKDPNSNWISINTKGDKVFTLSGSAQYRPSGFRNGLAVIEYNGNIGYCDKQGNMVIPIKFQKAKTKKGEEYYYDSPNFYNDKARVSLNGKNGYIDKKGNFKAD